MKRKNRQYYIKIKQKAQFLFDCKQNLKQYLNFENFPKKNKI